MAKAQDYTAIMQDMMKAYPVDMSAMQDAFKTQADLSEKLSKVALAAAEKSTEISNVWTKETLSKLNSVSTAKTEPADYSKAMTDFATVAAEMAQQHLAAFAEVAKNVQTQTVELMLSAGKTAGEEASAAVKKATDDMSAAAKKAAGQK